MLFNSQVFNRIQKIPFSKCLKLYYLVEIVLPKFTFIISLFYARLNPGYPHLRYSPRGSRCSPRGRLGLSLPQRLNLDLGWPILCGMSQLTGRLGGRSDLEVVAHNSEWVSVGWFPVLFYVALVFSCFFALYLFSIHDTVSYIYYYWYRLLFSQLNSLMFASHLTYLPSVLCQTVLLLKCDLWFYI